MGEEKTGSLVKGMAADADLHINKLLTNFIVYHTSTSFIFERPPQSNNCLALYFQKKNNADFTKYCLSACHTVW